MPAASLLAVATLLLGAGGTQAETDSWPRCTAWRDDPWLLRDLEAALVERVNRRRRVNERVPLSRDVRLDAVARDHSRAMADSGDFSHWSPDSGTVEKRLRSRGILDWSGVGENLAVASAARYRTTTGDGRYRSVGCHEAHALAGELVGGWDLSPGHRDNILRADYSHIGSGAAFDPASERIYVTHVFVRRSNCGFPGGPCCTVGGHAEPGACRSPLRCYGQRCTGPP